MTDTDDFELFMKIRKVGGLVQEALCRGHLPKDTKGCLTEAENLVLTILNQMKNGE